MEALKAIVAIAVQDDKNVVMINDVARAYFEAPAEREPYIEFPVKWNHQPGHVGRLKKSLYGTRDAAANWQKMVTTLWLIRDLSKDVTIHRFIFILREKSEHQFTETILRLFVLRVRPGG